MSRVFVTIGPITIYWYSVLILLAVFLGYEIAIRYCKRTRIPTSAIVDMVLGLVIWAIIGARIYFVLFNLSLYQDNFLEIFMIWKGGLAIYGAIIAGVLYIAYYCKKHELNFVKILDIFSLSLLLGQAIGRWGNFFNSEAYGGKTTYESLKSLKIPDFIIQGMYIDGAYRKPTFLYESLWCLIGVFILMKIRKKYSNKVGRQVCFYLMWYGIGRFFIEGLRSDSLYIGNFRVSQLVSVVLVGIGVVGSIVVIKKNRVKMKEIGGSNGRI